MAPRNPSTSSDLRDTRVVTHRTPASPEQVWEVIADGWTFAAWVVGASRVRAVDPSWPQPGATLHHSVGTWPVLISDSTSVVECEPGKRLVMSARTRPVGVHTVEIVLRALPAGGTELTMREDASSGPIRLTPKPLRQTGLVMRNAETLQRLALLAERNTDPRER